MRQIRRFQDLTIGDSYMFSAVMMENDNCRQLLERVLEMPISRVEVIKEKSMIYHPECKGVRLDQISAWARLAMDAKSLEDFISRM